MVSRANPMYRREGKHRVVMDVEHRPDAAVGIALVAAREVPGDRNTELLEFCEHDLVATAQLGSGQPATQRIVDVRVGAGLVEDDVTIRKAFEHLR